MEPRVHSPRMRVETPELSLTERERFMLATLLNDSSVRARRRARVVLDLADGKDPKTIARELNTRPVGIHRITHSFQERRLESFSAAALRRALSPRSQKPPLSGRSSMREAARHTLERQFSKLKHTEPGVRAADDVEAVHDMRVACRRMNSALRLFRDDIPKKRVKKLRPVLEQLRDALGATRDLDVMTGDLEKYRATVPEEDNAQLHHVAEAWRAERAVHQIELVELLDSTEYQTWGKRMGAFLEGDDKDGSARVADAVPALLWTQYGSVRAYETGLDTATLEELHALRIGVKRLRYTLEFFQDVFRLPDGTAGNADLLIEPLVALQDRLGSIQDCVVAGTALTDFIAKQAERARQAGETTSDFQAIAAYHAHLHSRITELRGGLRERWEPLVRADYRHYLADFAALL